MKPLVLIPQFFGSLVYDRRQARYLPFDQECTSLLLSAVDEPPEGEELSGFLRHFQGEGFWDLRGCFDGEVLPLVPPAGHLAGPLTVHLEVAGRCNLSCTHCFAGSLPRHEPALTLPELDRFFAELSSMGCFRLGMTGGEPLLRRDLLDLLDCAIGHGLQPSLTTNGLLLTETMARELGRRPLVWLNVSLEGAGPASNDPVRGEGTWKRVLEKLPLLRRHAAFSLAFTITSGNADEAQECVRLAAEVGAQSAVFRPLYPAGKALGQLDLMPTFARYKGAIESLTGEVFSASTRHRAAGRLYTGSGCGAANLICSVSLGGTVSPCSYLGSGFEAENLRERSFRDIWNSSQSFHRMRQSQDDAFEGGCRARALALAGSAWGRDPWQDEFRQDGGFAPATNWEA